MSYEFNLLAPPVRIAPPVSGTGYIFDAAGVRATTGSEDFDLVIRWMFWIGMALMGYKMYRVLRYEDPLFGEREVLPPAWRVNPADSDSDNRRKLESYGISLPSPKHLIARVRYISSRDDWYIQTETGDWYWYDSRKSSYGWKHAPLGPL